MKPKRIILVRHGESEGNVDRTIYAKKPDYTFHLTPKGREQASGAGLKIRDIVGAESMKFYVSPMWRTRETFEQIVQHLDASKISLREEPRLREQEWGHLRSEAETSKIIADRDAYGVFYFRIPDGESCADVYDRVTTFLETLHRDFDKPDFAENIVLVTHGMMMRLFLMRWLHWTVEEFEKVANPVNCGIWVMELQPNGKYLVKTELVHHEVAHSYQRPIILK